jgi:hypothetical protein
MSSDWYDVGKSPGGRRIQQYCLDEARKIGLRIERTSWSTDLVNDDQKYILTIIAKTGTTELTFTREEIDQYARTPTAQSAAKIKRALQDVL